VLRDKGNENNVAEVGLWDSAILHDRIGGLQEKKLRPLLFSRVGQQPSAIKDSEFIDQGRAKDAMPTLLGREPDLRPMQAHIFTC
jgi:hypothetical protein